LIAQKPQVSIKTSLRMTLLGIVLTVIGATVICHEFLRRDDAHRQAHTHTAVMTEMLAAQMAACDLNEDSNHRPVVRRLLDMPTLTAIGVWDADGETILLEGEGVKPISLLKSAHTGECRYSHRHYWLMHELKSEDGPLDVRFAQIGLGTFDRKPAMVGAVFDMRPMLAGFPQHLVMFYVPILMVGVGTFLVGCWWTQRELVRPLGSLLRTVEAASDDSQREPAKSYRHREFGNLAEKLAALRLDLHTWRNKAVMTERRVDNRIAEETQRITRDLQRLKAESWQDSLTGVYNRRFLDEKLPEVYEAQSAGRRDLSLAMFDLDYFKLLNDTAGHGAGDQVLQFIGELLRQMTRTGDFAVRYGGDEFMLIMPGLPASRAMAVSERVLAHFRQQAKVMVDVRPAPTLSVGVASIANNRPESLAELIYMADEVLLESKQNGKGRVTLATRQGDTKVCDVRRSA